MPPPSAYRFGPFQFDAASYRLLKDDRPVPLSPKVLDLLRLLVSRPSELVTKEAILRELWPDVAVTDNAITQAVSELRHGLKDNSIAPVYIQTVPRRGYRFIAAVDVGGPAPSPARFASDAPLARSLKRAIAVSNFENLTGDPNAAWLSAGIAETVTNDLRALPDLCVI